MPRRWIPPLTGFLVIALTAGCAKPVPLTNTIRQELGAADLTAEKLQVLGYFELRAGGAQTLTVKYRTPATNVRAVDDSTISLDVAAGRAGGASETLGLTFRPSGAAAGAYTLREVNGVLIGDQIPVGSARYQYVPCYTNVDWQCTNPIPVGSREDQGVRLGIMR
jgi:hypothetical protein